MCIRDRHWSVEIKASLYINFNKNNVHSKYRSVRESFTPAAGHSVDAACAQRGELACIPEAKVAICRPLVQRKGHTVGLLPVWQRLFKMQAKSFRWYRALLTLLASSAFERCVDANSSKWRHSVVTFVHFKLLVLQYKDNTVNRKINKYWQSNIWLSQLALYNSYVNWCDLAFKSAEPHRGQRWHYWSEQNTPVTNLCTDIFKRCWTNEREADQEHVLITHIDKSSRSKCHKNAYNL